VEEDAVGSEEVESARAKFGRRRGEEREVDPSVEGAMVRRAGLSMVLRR
jgi:hypothetical protein